MNILHSIIFGIVEGITEFLPISSTAHLILTAKILHIADSDFLKSFEIIIQLGSILAAVLYFGKRLLSNIELLKRAIIGFIPTGIIGLFLYKYIKNALGSDVHVAWTLLIGGILIIIFEKYYIRDEVVQPVATETTDGVQKVDGVASRVSLLQAFYIGCFQCLALIPGLSRSAATIIGGELIGVKKQDAVDFTFMLAIPTMAAATLYDLYKNYHLFSSDQIGVLSVGFLTSFFVAYIAIASFLRYIKKNSFTAFGWYRVVVGIFALLFIV